MAKSRWRGGRLRIGAVSYLNTKPLIFGFAESVPDAELVLDVPSQLAVRLAAGDLDVALIPSIETYRNSDYTILSDACIACRGPVLSVKLISRVPMPQIRSLALDAGSRTSVALVQILLQERFHVRPTLTTLPLGASECLPDVDAVLLIGDRAMHSIEHAFSQHSKVVHEEWDLGEEWCRWTGLPFVFAMWTARRDADAGSIAAALERVRDDGVAHLSQIAADEAAAANLGEEICLSYLRDHLHFTLGVDERKGLELFLRHANKMGFLSTAARTQTSATQTAGTLPTGTMKS